jgi:uncharacterized membrane protein YfcA
MNNQKKKQAVLNEYTIIGSSAGIMISIVYADFLGLNLFGLAVSVSLGVIVGGFLGNRVQSKPK